MRLWMTALAPHGVFHADAVAGPAQDAADRRVAGDVPRLGDMLFANGPAAESADRPGLIIAVNAFHGRSSELAAHCTVSRSSWLLLATLLLTPRQKGVKSPFHQTRSISLY